MNQVKIYKKKIQKYEYKLLKQNNWRSKINSARKKTIKLIQGHTMLFANQ